MPLRFEGVSKRFRGAGRMARALTLGRAPRDSVDALRDVSFNVGAREVVGVLGPNGSGKSTMMRLAAGLLSATTGQVIALGHDPAALSGGTRGRIGLVIRDDRAFNYRLSGRENLRVFGMLQRIPSDQLDERIANALERVRLSGVADRPFRTYSAGMKQRLGLGRALLGPPELLLMDEATSGLDPGLRERFYTLIRGLAEEGIGALFATHDLTEAAEFCDRVILLDRGTIAASGTYAEIAAQANAVFQRSA